MTVIYERGKTEGDWLRYRPHPIEISNTVLEFEPGTDIPSGALVGKVTATGLHKQYDTTASDGTETLVGIAVNPVNARATYATGTTGSAGTTKLTYTSNIIGVGGNNIIINLLDPEANSNPLTTTVEGDNVRGYDINIALATDAGGVITTVAADIVTELATNGLAPDTGAVLVTAVADADATPLAAESVTLAGAVEYPNTNKGVVLTNLHNCLLFFSNLAYTGDKATAKSALEAAGAVLAHESAGLA